MRYDYKCCKCNLVFEIDKRITDPDPSKCPECESKEVERYYCPETLPSVLYPGRPIWTYKECLKFKDCRMGDGPRVKIDPSKHGDIGAWNSPGEVVPFNKKDIEKAQKKRQKEG